MKYSVQVVVAAIGVFMLATTLLAATDPGPAKSQILSKDISDLEKEVGEQRKELLGLKKEIGKLRKEIGFLKMAPVPDLISLCDKPMPLFDEEVKEQFEREFYQFLENKGLLTILVKRQAKFLAVVSQEIEKSKMPPDLIYLAIAESYLNPRVRSTANAGGLWQFMKDTGKREGLFVNDDIDERYTVTRSTTSALAYLNKLNNEFGDWFLAMAAYNCGENRIREAIANQNTRSFFEMFLPEETNRYVYRIAALKEILNNPEKYGLQIEKDDYYRPYAVAEISVELDRETHTNVLAQAMQIPYKSFRMYNLHIRKYKLPRGIYRVYVPVEKLEAFQKGIKMCPGVLLQKGE
jgi:membrane-bound lytic murein transglycosylase D